MCLQQLLLFQLAPLEPLIQLKPIDCARIARAQIGSHPDALLQAQVERILLLLNVEPKPIFTRARGVREGGHVERHEHEEKEDVDGPFQICRFNSVMSSLSVAIAMASHPCRSAAANTSFSGESLKTQ